MHKFNKIDYKKLNARQKESYNYQKISGILADYGFTTMRLSDDWQGADFIAQHKDGEFLKVQLKGRLCFYTKYDEKDLYICCPFGADWLFYSHDELKNKVLRITTIARTRSWRKGGYSMKSVPKKLLSLVEPYILRPVTTTPLPEST